MSRVPVLAVALASLLSPPIASAAAPSTATVAGVAATSSNQAEDGSETERLLLAGQLGEAAARLRKLLREAREGSPEPDEPKRESSQRQQHRFEAGVVRFLQGVEGLGQALYQYSPRTRNMWVIGLPATRLPLPSRPNPAPIRYEDFRGVLAGWNAALGETAELLAGLGEADVKLTLRFGLVRLDFDGNGRGGEEEALWRIYAAFNPGAGLTEQNAAEFAVSLDRADAEWLRAYCHLLMAINEFALAHDFRELFERAGHLVFPNVVSPHAFLSRSGGGGGTFNFEEITDLIAYVHLINFEATEPERLTRCWEHLREMVRASRAMWKFALAERDADREWIPNPHQTGVIPNVQVTQAQVDQWAMFLDEVEALLEGRKLVPFWRNAEGKGVNLRRAIIEGRRFDLVLWAQGTAATPYLEEGVVTRREFWDQLQRTFGGNFWGFAAWWN